VCAWAVVVVVVLLLLRWRHGPTRLTPLRDREARSAVKLTSGKVPLEKTL
jgi:hypothetical protein